MIPFKFTGYCDESEDGTSLVIACVFARAAEWPSVAQPWQRLLEEYKMPEFHMEHCEHRKGFWESWRNPGERASVADRFRDLITDTTLPVPAIYATGVDLASFEEIAGPMIRRAHPGAHLDSPWLLAFFQVLQDMLEAQHHMNMTFQSHEALVLICDEKGDLSGIVRRYAAELKEITGSPLDDITFANSESAIGIQMADLVAYEMRKSLSAIILDDQIRGIRNQWKQLMEARLPNGQPRIYASFWDKEAMSRGHLPLGLR